MIRIRVGCVIISWYQLEDFLNIILSNKYTVELKTPNNNKRDEVIVTIYEKESEEDEEN